MNNVLTKLSTEFVAVMGLHSSGSSCLAGVLYHLGIHMGNKFSGFYGNDPQSNCGFEAVGLMNICRSSAPFPDTSFSVNKVQLELQLRQWINSRSKEAYLKQTIAGGKYPQLCQMGDLLQKICGEQLRIIISERPLDQSIKSLHKRFPDVALELVVRHQEWLEAGKTQTINDIPHDNLLVVSYEELLCAPVIQMQKITDFLKISPTTDQRQKALNWVSPSKRNITNS